MLPIQLANIFAFIDGTGNAICRPDGPGFIQNSFWNGYFHGHYLIYQAITFPDGMLVLEPPAPGHNTDVTVWRDCIVRDRLEQIMRDRENSNPPRPRYKLYADKIYNTCALITAAFSRRNGVVEQWMTNQNRIMSKLRVSIEWSLKNLKCLFKFMTFKAGQKIQKSPCPKHMAISALLANCHTCLYGDVHNDTTVFDILPPTLEDYLDQ